MKMKDKINYKAICDLINNPTPELQQAGELLNKNPAVMYEGVKYEGKKPSVKYEP